MFKGILSRVFNGQRECHARLDEAILRSNAARQRASEVCAGIDSGSTQRCSVDWGPSFEALSRAAAEDPLADVHLPVAAGDTLESQVPAPNTVHAEDRARVRRSVLGYHDEDCSPDTPQPRQKDLP